MATAKDIRLRPVDSTRANEFMRRTHYSGTVVQNSQLHIGVFLGGVMRGAIQFGPPLDKSKLLGLVEDTDWNGMLELNRMAFTDALPRNSESRALGVAMRLIEEHAPQVEWIVSFADAAQCGDGTIYRAANFILTGIKKTKNLVRLPAGDVIHKMTLESAPTRPRPELDGRTYFDVTGGKYDLDAYTDAVNGERVRGYQLRYMYFINPEARERLTVPEIPFERIDEVGAGMYRGERVTYEERNQAPEA